MKNYESKYWAVIAFVFISCLIIIGLYSYQFGIGLWSTPEKWGQLGDFFGGVLNPVIGFVTLILLLVTITQNQKALEYNSQELELTRNELSDSKKALQQQVVILATQSFNSTFFHMVSFLNDSSSNIRYESTEENIKNIKGKKAFQFYHQELIKALEGYSHRDFDEKQHVERQVLVFSQQFDREIGHYFKQIKNLLSHIDSSGIDNKEFYGNIISSQLSLYEKAILFYYALPDKHYKLLVERYALLSGLIPKHFNWDSGKFNPYSPNSFD